MLGEQVATKVALEVAHHGVHVVEVVLEVIELDEDRRPLDPIVAAFRPVHGARPREG